MPELIIRSKGRKYIVLFDEVHEPLVRAYNWFIVRGASTCYAYMTCRRKLSLHKYLFCPLLGYDIHHCNDNGLDCRQENIEYLTRSEHKYAHSATPGVMRNDVRGYVYYRAQWQGQYLGNFKTLEKALEAVTAYRSK